MRLFITGYLQVFFISINTIFLAKGLYIGVLFAAFIISFIWSGNVKRISIGSQSDRIVYSVGATLGSLTGLFITQL